MKILKLYIENKEKREDYSNGIKRQEYIEYIFVAKVRIGLKTKWYKFITLNKKYLCAFINDLHFSEPPKDKEIRYKILIEVYGELMKILAKYKMEETLIKLDKEIEEKRKEKEQKEKAKQIALGEQISIEKYLLNRA